MTKKRNSPLKLYRQKGEDCWRYSLAHLLRLVPKKVPRFDPHDSDYISKTRAWLKRKYKKGLVYVPASQFNETEHPKYNPAGYPCGECICVMLVEVDGCTEGHAAYICDGFIHEHKDSCCEKVISILGYFILYDLQVMVVD